ncbi:MAG: hypothetical protein E7307_08015 [Butyrivibrio sp.]|nr:hypothetical protein [Butyrivibrio sp.]
MNISNLLKERHEILKRIQGEFQEAMEPAMLREPENEGEPVILSVLFDDLWSPDCEALGEFYFLNPVSEDDEIQHLCGTITIAEEVTSSNFPQLFEAMSYINASLPCGAWRLDMEKRYLSYHLAVPVSIEMTGEELYRQMNIVMTNAYAAARAHADLIIKVMDREADIDFVKEALNPAGYQ